MMKHLPTIQSRAAFLLAAFLILSAASIRMTRAADASVPVALNGADTAEAEFRVGASGKIAVMFKFADGKAQTKTGKKLKLKDYTDAKVQAELKDEDMIKATADGVIVDGKEKMKGYKTELSADEIKDLVAYIRKFKA